jgi:membrane-bound lytic murein transglycosylase D
LEIWVEEELNKTAKLTQVASNKITTNEPQHISYQVLEGDSLWLISQRFDVSVNQIKKWNNLAKKRYIKPGQVLDIYIGTPPKDA